MNAPIRFSVVLAGVFILSGCGQAADPGPPIDHVFDISSAPPLPDGRPVVDIRPNGAQLPAGTGYNGSYLIVVRRNGEGYYVRWFYEKEAENGIRRDLALPAQGLKTGDKLTVAVENLIGKDPKNYVRLSNVLDLPTPPSSAPSFAIPNPKVSRPSP